MSVDWRLLFLTRIAKDPGLGMPAVDHAGHNFQTIAAHVDEQIADMRSLLIQQEMRAEESAAELRSHVASAVEELCQILDKNLSDGFGRWNNNLQDITRLSPGGGLSHHSRIVVRRCLSSFRCSR